MALLQAAWLDEMQEEGKDADKPRSSLVALQASLEACHAEWAAFEAALRGAGWPSAALSLEGEGRTRVVVSTGPPQ